MILLEITNLLLLKVQFRKNSPNIISIKKVNANKIVNLRVIIIIIVANNYTNLFLFLLFHLIPKVPSQPGWLPVKSFRQKAFWKFHPRVLLHQVFLSLIW